jgi:hypothetical protein
MNEFWERDLTEEESAALIEKAASEIARRGLQAPAILLLEMHRPLSFVTSHATVAFAPFLVPFLGFNAVNDYSRLFSKREHVERLIEALANVKTPEEAA